LWSKRTLIHHIVRLHRGRRPAFPRVVTQRTARPTEQSSFGAVDWLNAIVLSGRWRAWPGSGSGWRTFPIILRVQEFHDPDNIAFLHAQRPQQLFVDVWQHFGRHLVSGEGSRITFTDLRVDARLQEEIEPVVLVLWLDARARRRPCAVTGACAFGLLPLLGGAALDVGQRLLFIERSASCVFHVLDVLGAHFADGHCNLDTIVLKDVSALYLARNVG